MEDTDLIKLLKEGNEEAFVQIFNKYFEGLCLFSESIIKNHEAAEDLVEDLFLQVWINCNMNPIQTSIKRYLYHSIYNNSIKYISRQKKNIHIDQSWADESYLIELTSGENPMINLIVNDLEQKAEQIINSLPEECRKVYLLNRDEELKYQEIANRLNISVSTVKTQMARAFSKLREELKDLLYLFL